MRKLRYYLFISTLLGRWVLFMIGPFIPVFGATFIYDILLYCFDKQESNKKLDRNLLMFAIFIHSILLLMVYYINIGLY